MSDAVEQAESALRAFDEYWGDGGPVDAVYGRPFELIRALLAEVRASVVAEEPEWEYATGSEAKDTPGTYWVEEKARSLDQAQDWMAEYAELGSFANAMILRRRKAGPWVPVPVEQGGDDA